MTETPEKRKLSELRVVDLKLELEKRGKDGNGVKNVLLERLTQVRRDLLSLRRGRHIGWA